MRLVFACGASYEGVKEAPDFAHQRPDGSGRLLVYDSDAFFRERPFNKGRG